MPLATITPHHQIIIRRMLDAHGMRYEVTTDRRTGLEHTHVYDNFVCNGRTGYVLRDMSNWSLTKVKHWLGY